MVEGQTETTTGAASVTLTGIKRHITFFVIAFISLSLSTPSFGSRIDPSASLDYGLDLFEDKRYKNAETALMDMLEYSTFKQLDSSQRTMVYAHIAYSKINRGKEKESLMYIDKALAQTKREFGERSMRYIDHLKTKALALYWADQRHKAVRIGEKILTILERMDGDYRDEKRAFRYMISNMQKVNLEEGDLPVDLSDFYTDCESITSTNYLAKVDSIMNDYQLIGRDFKPNNKQSQYFKNTYIKHARESSKDRRSRIIFVPDDQHLEDWCVIYPDKNMVGRVVISHSNDR